MCCHHVRRGSLGVVCLGRGSSSVVVHCGYCRFDLDQIDTPDKYPDGFNITLDVAVSPQEIGASGQDEPWKGFSGKGLGPKILFASREEQHEIMTEYGWVFFLWSG